VSEPGREYEHLPDDEDDEDWDDDDWEDEDELDGEDDLP